jgi:tetratricopeptide (TPR) repeat protein
MKSSASKRILAAIVVVATALGTGVGADRASAQPSAADDEKARDLFRMGESHYIAGRYEKAAVLYEEAYRLSGRLELLLALANTCERMGDYGKAIEHLRQYLKSPKARKVDAVRDRLQRLETSLRQREEERQRLIRLERAERERERERRLQRQQAQQPPASSAPDAAGSTSAQVEVRSRPSRLPAYLFLAGGGAAIGGAVAFGILARRAHQDAEDLCADDLICPTSANRAIDREKRWAIAADVSAVVGVSSAAVGAFLWWRHRGESGESRSAVRLQGTLLPGGGGIGVAGDF